MASSVAWTTIKNAIATWILTASGLTSDRLRWAGQNAPEPTSSPTLPWILIGRFTWSNPGSDWSQYESNPLVLADKTITFDATADTGATPTAHGLLTRDGPVQFETTGSLAGTNLTVATNYWTTRIDATTLKFSTSFPNADAGVFIDIQGAGTGVHTMVSTADTRRAGQELREVARGARRVTFDVQCFPPVTPLGTLIPDDSDPVAILSDIVAKAALQGIATPLAEAGIGILNLGDPQQIDGVLNSVYFEPRATMTVVFATTSEVSGTETIIDYVNLDEDPGSGDIFLDLTAAPNEP